MSEKRRERVQRLGGGKWIFFNLERCVAQSCGFGESVQRAMIANNVRMFHIKGHPHLLEDFEFCS